MRRKKDGSADTSGPGGRVTPTDVQQVEFRLAFRGYNERDVDAFLDRVTEDLAAYIEENQRLRAGLPTAAPAIGASDEGAARTEADRILAEARQEAARIVGEAEARAAALGAPGGDPRAAVAPFLTTEREFLQRLGGLVQGHAEEIKQMVLALRARTAESQAPAPAEAGTTGLPRDVDPDALGEAEPVTVDAEPTTEPATTADEAFAPISVPESEIASEDTETPPDREETEPAPARLRTDSGDRSLRELFWGED